MDIRPSDDARTDNQERETPPATAGAAQWQLNRREALALMASALAISATPWVGAESAAAAASTQRRIDDEANVIAFSGAHTTTQLTVSVIALNGATKARVQLFVAASGAPVGPPSEQPIPINGITMHTFTGLTPNTRYKYVPALKSATGAWVTYGGDGDDGHAGWCWTMPLRSATTYARKVVLLGCQKTAHVDGTNVEPHSYDKIWAQRADVTDLVHLGDFHYMEIKEPLPKPHVDGYKAQLTRHTYLRQALRVAGLIYTPSDHEAGPNNGESGGKKWTTAGHEAINRVFPMHSFLVAPLANEFKDVTRVVECGRMLWVFADFRNYQRTDSAGNFVYERDFPDDPNLPYRAYGADVSKALFNAMRTWRDNGGVVVFWSDPVPYSRIRDDGTEYELHEKTDAFASYPATRKYLFPEIDEGLFSDYHNICYDDGSHNLHGPSAWFGCSGQWVGPTFRGGEYQYVLDQDGVGGDVRSVYATVDFAADATKLTSTKRAYRTFPNPLATEPQVATFNKGPLGATPGSR